MIRSQTGLADGCCYGHGWRGDWSLREAAAGAEGAFFTERDGTICGNSSYKWFSGSSARCIFRQRNSQIFA